MRALLRPIGLAAVLLALAATWLLPTLHTPCPSTEKHSETCCSHDHAEHEKDSPHKPDHHDHDEHDCALCQIMFLGAIGANLSIASENSCGFAPRIALISPDAQRPESIKPPRYHAARGPPIG